MAKSSVKIRDIDKGFKHIKRQFKVGARGISTSVGVNVEEGTQPSTKSSDVTVAEIALIHEFGLPSRNIPSRSFLRSTVDENNDFRKDINKLFTNIILRRIGLNKAMQLLGLEIESKVKNKIRSGIPPALKEDTVRRKGSSKPLVDTGQLLRSIKARVRRG